MKLTNGTDTVVLTDEIQIRAYLGSGYTEVKEKPAVGNGSKSSKAKS